MVSGNSYRMVGVDYQSYLAVVGDLNGLGERLALEPFIALSLDRWRAYNSIWRAEQMQILADLVHMRRQQLAGQDKPAGSEEVAW